jgi:hypothetical protein
VPPNPQLLRIGNGFAQFALPYQPAVPPTMQAISLDP